MVAILMADVPHFDFPFKLRASAVVVEQDSIDDIVNCVQIVLRVHQEWRPEAPDFGLPDITFQNQPFGREPLRQLIVDSEPRAQLVISEQPSIVDELIDQFTVEVGRENPRA